ncbi:adenylate kinase [Coprinopsis marcescibilis]|uniref:Adenylate kinase n=1 Tax=Coprinopsis marcescibilis TaxID=230819 RepID=A0A5C3LAB6_COPMA|nr:adenylate kinase [Coprinopsis marcescibilis]
MSIQNTMKLSSSLGLRLKAAGASRSTRITTHPTFTLQAQLPCNSFNTHRTISRLAVSQTLNASTSKQDDRDERVVRMVMFGKPGAGKGTLSNLLVKHYDILSISTGDLLRLHIAQKTDVGRQVEGIMARGGLVPDELMLKIVTSKLDSLHNKHWILDGFPRTLDQSQLLDAHLRKQNTPLSLVVNLNVPDEVILSRISDRWVHLASGRVYNTSYNPPRVPGYDDVTGEPLTKRPDDNPEIFSRRLQAFYAATSPILSHYQNLASQQVAPPKNPYQHPHQVTLYRPTKVAVRTLSGNTSDEIWPELDYVMLSMFPGLKRRVDVQANRMPPLTEAIAANLAATSFGK